MMEEQKKQGAREANTVCVGGGGGRKVCGLETERVRQTDEERDRRTETQWETDYGRDRQWETEKLTRRNRDSKRRSNGSLCHGSSENDADDRGMAPVCKVLHNDTETVPEMTSSDRQI